MKIAVCAKQIPDPALEITYNGGNINRPDEQVLDDTDRYGIEVALQLKEMMISSNLFQLSLYIEFEDNFFYDKVII